MGSSINKAWECHLDCYRWELCLVVIYCEFGKGILVYMIRGQILYQLNDY